MTSPILEKSYRECKSILAHTNHKIFTIRKKFFRIGQPILGVRPDEHQRSIIFVRKFHEKIHVAFAQSAPHGLYDQSAVIEMERKFPKLIVRKPRLISYIRDDNWTSAVDIIVPEQHMEFKVLITGTRLS